MYQNAGSRKLSVLSVALALTVMAACGNDSTGSAATTTTAASTGSSAKTTVQSATTTAVTGATSTAASSGSSGSTTDATPSIVSATNDFLATLTAAEKKSVSFDFTNTAQRQKWSNLPEGLYTRSGIMWGNMTAASQAAWLKVMQATLSADGYNRVRAEWAADDFVTGGNYGQKYYWIAIMGTPSTTAKWQWQWGGHHVTINATISGSNLSLTPSFIGVQPATYTANAATVKPLGDIVSAAFGLVNSLDATQKGKAVRGSTLIDLVLGPGQDGKTIAAEGLAGADMTATQKAAFLKLIGFYGNLANAEDAASRIATLTSQLDQTYFAWYGPTTEGSGMYFRVTGPSVVIEYSGQSMGGDTANHIHGIYRDPTNEYGASFGAGLS